MLTKVQKWGNSQGLRITKHVLDDARIEIGDDVEVVATKNQITIRKIIKPKFVLEEMVAKMPSDYKVSEEDFGKPAGREEW